MRSLTFGRDEMIFEEGTELNGAYLLVSGTVSLQLALRGEIREIALVGPGEFFGEAGMYGVQPAVARAVALEDSDVLWLAPETVRVMFESSPRLARETGHALDVRRRARLAARSSVKVG